MGMKHLEDAQELPGNVQRLENVTVLIWTLCQKLLLELLCEPAVNVLVISPEM